MSQDPNQLEKPQNFMPAGSGRPESGPISQSEVPVVHEAPHVPEVDPALSGIGVQTHSEEAPLVQIKNDHVQPQQVDSKQFEVSTQPIMSGDIKGKVEDSFTWGKWLRYFSYLKKLRVNPSGA